MLVYKISEVLQACGIKNPVIYLVKAGIGKSKAIGLLKNTQKTITLLDLSKLCQLLQCTPNDLLDWQPNSKFNIAENHPILFKLSKIPKNANWYDLVSLVDKAKAVELYKKVAEMIEEMNNQK
jgi:Cro/C1-type HTH DNA-binding domain